MLTYIALYLMCNITTFKKYIIVYHSAPFIGNPMGPLWEKRMRIRTKSFQCKLITSYDSLQFNRFGGGNEIYGEEKISVSPGFVIGSFLWLLSITSQILNLSGTNG